MTEEVGAVTGELEVATRLEEGSIEVKVRYADAEEWYTVEGGPVVPRDAQSLSSAGLRKLHEHIVEHLRRPGLVVGRNEEPVSLKSLTCIPTKE